MMPSLRDMSTGANISTAEIAERISRNIDKMGDERGDISVNNFADLVILNPIGSGESKCCVETIIFEGNLVCSST